MKWLFILDLLGTFVFAISGGLAAYDKKYDVVGIFILALVTALGGGSLRDILIGETPVSWMIQIEYLVVVTGAVILTLIFKNNILKLRKSLFFFDSLGIGLFTILGIQKTLSIGLSPTIAVLMGTVSAVFGGVLRDVLSNEVPLIFRKEIYASACVIGGIVFLLTQELLPNNEIFPTIMVMILVFGIRYFSIKRGWTLHFK